MNNRKKHRICTTAILAILAVSGTALAAAMQTQAVLSLYSFDTSFNLNFVVQKRETYNVSRMQQRLRDLRTAAFDYASIQGSFFPSLASELFVEGYVADPLNFYSDGDSDLAPTTIDNDVPNAANSAQISFDFPGAGISTFGMPSSTIIFRDNAASNNAGLGKFFATLGSSTIQFEPASPRTFSQIPTILTPSSPTTINRNGDPPGAPFSFNLPPDAALESFTGPHQFDLLAEGTITQDILDVFAAEGFAGHETIQMLANGGIGLSNTSIVGPASSTVEVSAFVQVDALIIAPTGSEDDFLTVAAMLTAHDIGSNAFVQSRRILSGNPDWGFSSFLAMSVVERYIIPLGDPRYIAGMTSVEFRLVAHLPILMDTSKEYFLQLLVAVLRVASVDPSSTPGDFASISAQVLHPTTPSQTQIKFYVPPGYSFSMNDANGPNDLIFPAIKGDVDLDGIIGPTDQAAFIAAYTRPLGGSNYTPASFDELSTFDFEGDGDVDCEDHQRLVDSWSAGGGPSAFTSCDSDTDTDGIPNGDDDCAGTPTGTTVSDNGCPQGDFNQDGVFDAADGAALVDCMEGISKLPNPTPPVTIAACINTFDLDGDSDIDLEDYASMQRLVP